MSLVIPGILDWSIWEDPSYGNLELGLVKRCSKGDWSRGAEAELQECLETLARSD